MQAQGGDPWASALAQLTGACGDGASMRALGWLDGVPREEKAVRYNPRPPGVVRFGSTAHAVWAVFEAQPHRWFERYELIDLTLGSRKAVDWALIYLERLGSLDVSRPAPEALHGNAHPTRYRMKCAAAICTSCAGVRRGQWRTQAVAELVDRANAAQLELQ